MKNRRCPNRICCIDYECNSCEVCDLGNHILKLHKKIDRLKAKNKKFEAQKQELLEIYKQRMAESIDNFDEEVGHMVCDGVLCDLLHDLGFDEVLKIYDTQTRWYA